MIKGPQQAERKPPAGQKKAPSQPPRGEEKRVAEGVLGFKKSVVLKIKEVCISLYKAV